MYILTIKTTWSVFLNCSENLILVKEIIWFLKFNNIPDQSLSSSVYLNFTIGKIFPQINQVVKVCLDKNNKSFKCLLENNKKNDQ